MELAKPRKYDTAEDLEKKVDQYFAVCEKDDVIPYRANMCLYLGISQCIKKSAGAARGVAGAMAGEQSEELGAGDFPIEAGAERRICRQTDYPDGGCEN